MLWSAQLSELSSGVSSEVQWSWLVVLWSLWVESSEEVDHYITEYYSN